MLNDIIEDVMVEYQLAVDANGPFNSAHEGWAVLMEELDELWEEVKKKRINRDSKNIRKECTQIAAIAIRFIVDICDHGRE